MHLVIDQISPDMPVYRVKPETGDGRVRTLYRNILLPIDYLNDEEPHHRGIKLNRSVPRSTAKAKVSQHPSDSLEGQDSGDDELVKVVTKTTITIPT